MERESGYYWVKWKGKWYVAYYSDVRGSFDIFSITFYDNEFDEINETKLTPPEE